MQRRQQEHQVQAAAGVEDAQHGSHGQGKDERAETADEMLDRLLEDMKTPGKEQGETKIIDRKGSWGRRQSLDWRG